MSAEHGFALELTLQGGYEFAVRFGGDVPELTVDEAPPLGADRGPSPSRLLATAIGQCLGSSLLYCLRRSRVEVPHLTVAVSGTIVRNERGRLRIGALHAKLVADVDDEQRQRMGRCLELFEDFCIVTESVRSGIPVTVEVEATSARTATLARHD